MQPDAAVLLDDEERGGLQAAFVATRRLTALERGHESVSEVARRPLEARDHAIDYCCAGEDVALRRAVRVRGRARLVARPRGRLGTCVRVDVALGVDDGEVASLLGPVLRARVRITPPDRLDDLLGSDALAKQLDCARTVANVDNRLRCRGADAGLCREHAVADCEDAR